MSLGGRDDINAREKEPSGVLAGLVSAHEILHGGAHNALINRSGINDSIEAQEHAETVACRRVALGLTVRFCGADDVRESCLRDVIHSLRNGVGPVVKVQGAPQSRRERVCFPSATDPDDGAPRELADKLGDDVRVEGVELFPSGRAGMVFH